MTIFTINYVIFFRRLKVSITQLAVVVIKYKGELHSPMETHFHMKQPSFRL